MAIAPCDGRVMRQGLFLFANQAAFFAGCQPFETK
jgi:hypothetical protein